MHAYKSQVREYLSTDLYWMLHKYKALAIQVASNQCNGKIDITEKGEKQYYFEVTIT